MNIINSQLFTPTFTGIPPYHVFTIHDEYFLFDTHSKRTYKIEEIFFRFLEYRLKHTTAESTQYLKSLGKYPRDKIIACSQLFEQLVENGILDITPFAVDSEQLQIYFDFFQQKGISKAEILLAESCNLACLYCFCRENNKNNNHLMTIDTAKKVVDKIIEWSKTQKRLSINFFGGEPLLNIPVLKFILEYARSKEDELQKTFFFSMTTNATLVTDEVLSLIEKYHIVRLAPKTGQLDLV